MDGWMDGWMDGLVNGWMGGWMDRQMDGYTDGQMDGCIKMKVLAISVITTNQVSYFELLRMLCLFKFS